MSMLKDPSQKYRPFPQVPLPDRQWPARTITAPPRWLSTDLRDGNQSIIDPMDAVKKNRFFDMLVEIGLKEIEIGFPAAGKTEFDFIQSLVQSDRIPGDVIVQVLTQSREDLIRTSFESLAGAKQAIVHLYNRGQPRMARHRVPHEQGRSARDRGVGREDPARRGGEAARHRLVFRIQPETFSTAELDFSLEVCEAVMDVLQPTRDHS